MIFDALWRAERTATKKRKKLHETLDPKIQTANKEKKGHEYESLLSEYFMESNIIRDMPDSMRTERLVRRARKLGISVPPQPSHENLDEDEYWEANPVSGSFYLTEKAFSELTRAIRKEEIERLEYQMRWVSRVFAPIVGLAIGLIGAIMGLISLIHSLKK
jgi:hypothetical protein